MIANRGQNLKRIVALLSKLLWYRSGTNKNNRLKEERGGGGRGGGVTRFHSIASLDKIIPIKHGV